MRLLPALNIPEEQLAAAVRYGTQIFAGAKLLKENDPAFLGYKVSVVHAGSLYRYVIGVSTSEQEARALFPKIKEKYKDAFFVEIDPAKCVKCGVCMGNCKFKAISKQ